jgi:hypothetical protein
MAASLGQRAGPGQCVARKPPQLVSRLPATGPRAGLKRRCNGITTQENDMHVRETRQPRLHRQRRAPSRPRLWLLLAVTLVAAAIVAGVRG